jgi:hypothetical protein
MGAIVALIHDVSITVGLFSIFGKEFTLPIIAALLTIIGYSLNDTIIVFDRIRENLKSYHKNAAGVCHQPQHQRNPEPHPADLADHPGGGGGAVCPGGRHHSRFCLCTDRRGCWWEPIHRSSWPAPSCWPGRKK